MPALRLITTEFEPIGYIDSASSVQLHRNLYEVGDMEIHINRTQTDADKLVPGVIAYLDERRAAMIESYDEDEDNAGMMIAKGKQLKDLCRFRGTVPGQIEETQYYGYDRYPAIGDPDAPAESIIKHYIDRHMVAPEDPHRVYPGVIIAPDLLRGPLMRWQSRNEPLTDIYKSIGEQTGMGYDIRLDIDNSRFIFDVIAGRDRTSGSDYPVVFSSKWSNVSGLKYTENAANYYNTAYCGGAGENEGRLIQTVYEDDVIRSGFARREIFIDCGSIDNIDDLIYEGKYKLAGYAYVRGLSGEIAPAGPFVYMKDWDLGDMVTIQSRTHERDARITEVREIYERGKVSVIPTFGKRNKSFLDEIRRTGVVR